MDVGYRQIISVSATSLIIALAVISTVGLTTLFDHSGAGFDHSGAGLSIHGIVSPRHDGATPRASADQRNPETEPGASRTGAKR